MKHLTEADLQYTYVENKAFIGSEGLKLREKIYGLWLPEWTQIYKDLGSNKLPSLRDFAAYDIINCIFADEQIIGMSAHKFMNLDEPLNVDSEFIQSLGPDYTHKLIEHGIKRVMTFESLMVAPEFRKSKNPIPLARAVLYLANHVFALSSAEAIIAAARKDLKVSDMAQTMGYNVFEENKQFRVFPCDLVVQTNRDLYYPNDKAWHLASKLWSNRNSYVSDVYVDHAALVRKVPLKVA